MGLRLDIDTAVMSQSRGKVLLTGRLSTPGDLVLG